MFCVKCGAENPDDAEFCCKCGKPAFRAQSTSGIQAPAPPVSTNPVSTPSTAKPYGIGGWLAFLCVSLAIITPFVWAASTVSFFNKGEVALGVLALLMALFSFIAGLFLWQKDPSAIKLAKAYLLVNIGVSLIISFAGTPGSLDDPHVLGSAIGQSIAVLVLLSIVTAIWWAYLNKSLRVKNTYGAVASIGPGITDQGDVPSPTAESQLPLTTGEAQEVQTTSASSAEAEVPAPPTVAPPPKPTIPGKLSEEPKTDYRLLAVFIGIVLFAMFVITMAVINLPSAKDSAPVQDSSQLSTTPAVSRDFTKEDLSALRILNTTSIRKTEKESWARWGGGCSGCTDEPMYYQVWLTVSNKSQATLHTLKTQVTLPAYHISGESLEFNCQHDTLEGSVPDILPNTTGDCASDTWPKLWDNRASFLITGAQVPEH